ncbi:hypothetical protein DH2020_044723 [Rehmannia glutinosa]|uniref:Uncharacterized protein n=1 Tax=Rehmannia glutinosa TaxID=99300 RepID=A0ABR0UGD3_REHGL
MEVKSIKEVNEEAQAQLDIWKYVFSFTPMAVVKCAIEFQIADVLETHGRAMTNADLSAALGCSPSILHRIMSPVMLAPWHKLSSRALTNGASAFDAAHGKSLWEYTSENPAHNKQFNDAMASHARLAMSAIIDHYPETFKGIGSLVDVGGGDGTALRTLVKACPWIHGINFDLPHVANVALHSDGIEHVGGDMFEMVPKADIAFLMCIDILRKCREAIPKDTGKVIIAEAVIKEGEQDKYNYVRLALDMVMLANTEKGKERTIQEWEYVVNSAGFSRYTV